MEDENEDEEGIYHGEKPYKQREMNENTVKIPQTIHYCWFGKKTLPESAVKCISSWKEYLPGYEIKEWNEDNFDINSCLFVREAYERKSWAFVSDYARFKIMYENGGLYFDTDVELIKPIDDIIAQGPFMACEPDYNISRNSSSYVVATGLGFAVEQGNKLCKEILNEYEQIERYEGNSLVTVVEKTTGCLKKHGYCQDSNITEVDNIRIYPPEYFCPFNFKTGKMRITENTRSIHHYDATWMSKSAIKSIELTRRFSNGGKPKRNLGNALTIPYRFANRVKADGFINTIKYILQKDNSRR